MTPHEIFKEKMEELKDINKVSTTTTLMNGVEYVSLKLPIMLAHQKSLALALLKGVEMWAEENNVCEFGCKSTDEDCPHYYSQRHKTLSDLKAFLTAECELINKTN